VRRTAHAHAVVSWKCRRADVSWPQATEHDAAAAVPAADDDDDDDDDDGDESSTGPGLDVTGHVTANFTGLVHSLHAW